MMDRVPMLAIICAVLLVTFEWRRTKRSAGE